MSTYINDIFTCIRIYTAVHDNRTPFFQFSISRICIELVVDKGIEANAGRALECSFNNFRAHRLIWCSPRLCINKKDGKYQSFIRKEFEYNYAKQRVLETRFGKIENLTVRMERDAGPHHCPN